MDPLLLRPSKEQCSYVIEKILWNNIFESYLTIFPSGKLLHAGAAYSWNTQVTSSQPSLLLNLNPGSNPPQSGILGPTPTPGSLDFGKLSPSASKLSATTPTNPSISVNANLRPGHRCFPPPNDNCEPLLFFSSCTDTSKKRSGLKVFASGPQISSMK